MFFLKTQEEQMHELGMEATATKNFSATLVGSFCYYYKIPFKNARKMGLCPGTTECRVLVTHMEPHPRKCCHTFHTILR
jgi:hypothetical protein